MQMTSFATFAILASYAAAGISSVVVEEDGVATTRYISSPEFAEAYGADGTALINPNSHAFLQGTNGPGADAAYRPALLGGSISYSIDMSYNDCGCVSALYLVQTDNDQCSHDSQPDSNVQCASIDVMQGNNYGFNVGANPCVGGQCDPVSQCFYDMRTEGEAAYGADAYGPGGSLINTYATFDVKTEFLSTADYSSLWGLRTTISQGDKQIVMKKDCRDYLSSMTDLVDGGMQFVFSNWENTDNTIDFENEKCAALLPCSQGYSRFTNLRILTEGSNEDPDGGDDGDQPDEPVMGAAAPYLDSGNCGMGCTECREMWTSETEFSYECVDRRHYQFGSTCADWRDSSACATEQGNCVNSWPAGDPDRWNSSAAKCRTIPELYTFCPDSLEYADSECKPSHGMCQNGCGEGETCHKSWPKDDPTAWKSTYSVCRCKANM